MAYIMFNEAVNNNDVAINPALVRFLRRATNGRTLVLFDNSQSLTVVGTLEEVIEKLTA